MILSSLCYHYQYYCYYYCSCCYKRIAVVIISCNYHVHYYCCGILIIVIITMTIGIYVNYRHCYHCLNRRMVKKDKNTHQRLRLQLVNTFVFIFLFAVRSPFGSLLQMLHCSAHPVRSSWPHLQSLDLQRVSNQRINRSLCIKSRVTVYWTDRNVSRYCIYKSDFPSFAQYFGSGRDQLSSGTDWMDFHRLR